MRFHWTLENNGDQLYALRDANGYTRACIHQEAKGQGFYGLIFLRNLPDSGPYKSRQEAADWVARILVKLEAVPADSEFGPLPQLRRAA